MVSEPKFLSSEMVDEARFSELCNKVAEHREESNRKFEALSAENRSKFDNINKQLAELREMVTDIASRLPGPSLPLHAAKVTNPSISSVKTAQKSDETPDLAGSGNLMSDDDFLVTGRLELDDVVIIDKELSQLEAIDESKIEKNAADSGAYQVFDEMSRVLDNPEMKTMNQIAKVVDELLLLMAPNEGNVGFEALKVNDLKNTKAFLIVKNELRDLIIVLNGFPTQGGITLGHMIVMSFDPGGEEVACVDRATRIVTGKYADFCCHSEADAKFGHARVNFTLQRRLLAEETWLGSFAAEINMLLHMLTAQGKMTDAYIRLLCFDPGGVNQWVKYIARDTRQSEIKKLILLWMCGYCVICFDKEGKSDVKFDVADKYLRGRLKFKEHMLMGISTTNKEIWIFPVERYLMIVDSQGFVSSKCWNFEYNGDEPSTAKEKGSDTIHGATGGYFRSKRKVGFFPLAEVLLLRLNPLFDTSESREIEIVYPRSVVQFKTNDLPIDFRKNFEMVLGCKTRDDVVFAPSPESKWIATLLGEASLYEWQFTGAAEWFNTCSTFGLLHLNWAAIDYATTVEIIGWNEGWKSVINRGFKGFFYDPGGEEILLGAASFGLYCICVTSGRKTDMADASSLPSLLATGAVTIAVILELAVWEFSLRLTFDPGEGCPRFIKIWKLIELILEDKDHLDREVLMQEFRLNFVFSVICNLMSKPGLSGLFISFTKPGLFISFTKPSLSRFRVYPPCT